MLSVAQTTNKLLEDETEKMNSKEFLSVETNIRTHIPKKSLDPGGIKIK